MVHPDAVNCVELRCPYIMGTGMFDAVVLRTMSLFRVHSLRIIFAVASNAGIS
jgi:hypothetical protein